VSQAAIVWPATVSLAPLVLPAGQDLSYATPSELRSGHDGDRQGVRPYQDGDSWRNIVWSLTARHGRLIVSERQESARCAVAVILELRPEKQPAAEHELRREWAVRVAASVVESLAREQVDARLELVTESGTIGRTSSWRQGLDLLSTFDGAGGIAAASRPRISALPSAAQCDYSIVICSTGGLTHACDTKPLRSIFLADGRRRDPDGSDGDRSAWISLDLGGDVAVQLQSLWARRAEESWCARC
jgi:uncharacterized protein (DUF58 family)